MKPKKNLFKELYGRVAVIIPACDEAQTIGETITGFHRALPEAAIYVVNNDSQDRTAEIARSTLAASGIAGAVIDEARRGKGNALRRACNLVMADAYLIVDGDMTYPSERAGDLLTPVLSGQADMVVGDRLSGGDYARENRRRFHSWGNRLVQRTINLLFATRLHDVMSGYRACSGQFIRNYPILVAGFQVETDMTLHALHHRFRILEIPVAYRDRPQGSVSKLKTVPDGIKVVLTIARILRYYRPLFFFSLLSAGAAACGLLAALPVFQDWIVSRYIFHVPLAILAAALEMVAVFLFGIGLILDAMTHHQRLAFELRLKEQSRRLERGEPGVDPTSAGK